MTDFATCENCRGRKRVRGMGMMEMDCLTCAGLGVVSTKPVSPIEEIPEIKTKEGLANPLTSDAVLVAPKRRGRPAAAR